MKPRKAASKPATKTNRTTKPAKAEVVARPGLVPIYPHPVKLIGFVKPVGDESSRRDSDYANG